MPTRLCLRCRGKISKGSYCKAHRPYSNPAYQKLSRTITKTYQGLPCPDCGEPMTHPSLDHIKPAGRGGTEAQGNLRVVCITCNKRKHD